MAQLLQVSFKADEIQKLMELGPDRIVVRTSIQSGILSNGESVGYLLVEADAMKDGDDKPLGTVGGCPCPPCSA